MKLRVPAAHFAATFILATACFAQSGSNPLGKAATAGPGSGPAASVSLPAPYSTPSNTKYSKVIGWPAGQTPKAPAGFSVSLFAGDLDSPRWLYVLPNGDVLVAEARTKPKLDDDPAQMAAKAASGAAGPSADRITLFRDADRDGKYEMRETFLTGVNQPFGMLALNGHVYVAGTDSLWRFPYKDGQIKLIGPAKKITDLPAGGYNNHWTRNVIASPDGSKIYVSVGSGSNVGENGIEKEERRANILELNPDGSGEKIYAAGLRNPNAMDWNPVTKVLWTAVNERDALGDDLVPDYLTSVRRGGFYGWPYAYWGPHEDPRLKGKRPDLVAKSIAPDVPLGSHTACLGFTFYKGSALPERYRGGAFVTQHGSWNRSQISGYKMLFVPFANGKPSGPPEDFLTGFIKDEDSAQVYGRPVGVVNLPDGSLLIADDAAGKVWRVSAARAN